MSFFDKFTSNTYAGSANQYLFEMKEGESRTSRVFYKISVGGEYNYSLLYSSITDGSFRRIGKPNVVLDEWKIQGARIGRCTSFPEESDISRLNAGEIDVKWLGRLTFDGKRSYIPDGGELFCTDPQSLFFEKGDYLCVELTFSGSILPCHPEIQVPVYVLKDGEWKYDVNSPLPVMIGCDRPVKKRIAYLGDSITQGCGAGLNSYKHWNATLSEALGEDFAYWNLGIGYGKASDAASDGVHMYKALQNDTVFVCYGVNDINADKDADTIIGELSSVIDRLKDNGCQVILQTVPPFDYPEARKIVWLEVNRRIIEELSKKVDYTFDCTNILSKSKDEPHMAKFGGHPDAEGCTLWAEALYEKIKNFF